MTKALDWIGESMVALARKLDRCVCVTWKIKQTNSGEMK